jgi:C-terminal processing protease CtpA/Prc
VGRWSAGSALNTREYPLPDGGHCYIPFEDFVRGGERRIEGVGVAPDVWAMSTLTEIRAGRDVALEEAVLAIKKAVPGTNSRN